MARCPVVRTTRFSKPWRPSASALLPHEFFSTLHQNIFDSYILFVYSTTVAAEIRGDDKLIKHNTKILPYKRERPDPRPRSRLTWCKVQTNAKTENIKNNKILLLLGIRATKWWVICMPNDAPKRVNSCGNLSGRSSGLRKSSGAYRATILVWFARELEIF